MLTEWVLFLFMNGWIIEVDIFTLQKNCLSKESTFTNALRQVNSGAKVWCEQRPIAKLPVIIDKNK